MRALPLRATILGSLLLGVGLAAADTALRYRKIDTNHSTVGFAVPIAGGMSEVTGKFTEFTVELDWIEGEEGSLSGSSVKAVIEAASIDTGIPQRDEHLRTADFFDVEKHPKITFESRDISRRGEDYVAKGAFTMKGTSKEIELPFRLRKQTSESGKVMLGIAADLTIDRQEYGVAWRHPDATFVGDRVAVKLRILTKLRPPETRD